MDKFLRETLTGGEYDVWKKILGKETLDYIIENWNEEGEDIQECEIKALLDFCQSPDWIYEADWLKEQCFFPFYGPLLAYGADLMNTDQKNGTLFDESVQDTLMKFLFSRLENVSVRVLIREMRALKEEGKLFGEDTHKEYEHYVNCYLYKGEYRKEILKKYKAMAWMIYHQIKNFQSFIRDFETHLRDDTEELTYIFFQGKTPGQIKELKLGASDAHFGGRTVIRVTWTDGHVLYYKPRSLKNDRMYQDIYMWISGECHMESYAYRILDKGQHGWCEAVLPQDCENKEQVERYFKRLGLQLFICYLFSVKDMHFENILACGEYPVLVDLETFPGRAFSGNDLSMSGQAFTRLADSVLMTGALPVTVWNFDGQGVRLGAVGRQEKQKLPVRIPVIIGGKTSEMDVVLVHPEFEVKGNLPGLGHKTVDPSDYVNQLTEGFSQAYRFALENKPLFLTKGRAAFAINSRVLLRNTQQYHMYTQTAGNGFFMTHLWRQKLLFCNLYNSTRVPEEWKSKVVSYEVRALCQRDIPYFYMNGMRTSLFDSFGNEYENYYESSPMESYRKMVEGLSGRDEMFQERLIRLSLAMTPEDVGKMMNVRTGAGTRHEITNEDCLAGAKAIGRDLLDFSISGKDGKEVLWITLKYFGWDEMNWRIDVQSMYLYDGLAGTGLFLSALAWLTEDLEVTRAFLCVRSQLFDYTRSLLENGCPKDAPTGIFAGEGSVIYTYLIWYTLFKDPFYLLFAKKHSQCVEKIYKNDTHMDLLTGNAGLMIAWEYLYDLTKDMHYLHLAQDAGDCLRKHVMVMEQGAGFTAGGEQVPLAGMSHGCSGFILAFAGLYARSHRAEDAWMIRQLLAYEDSLYDPSINNWADLRLAPGKNTAGIDAVAWCHGAPGIFLARQAMQKYCPDIEPVIVEQDIKRALSKIGMGTYREGFCLCHGNCGNSWIVKDSNREFYEIVLGDVLERIRSRKLLPQEKFNPGFMAGISGIGYALLREVCPQLPDVLAVSLEAG